MLLIYCSGGNRKYASIAVRHGYAYGAQLPDTVYFPTVFCDQNFKTPNRERYMKGLAQHKPAMATVIDWMHDDQLDEVLSWADEAAQYVTDSVIIIPKVHSGISRLPRSIRGKAVRLGYSVPTAYGGTEVMLMEFAGWRVHLLGGQPQAQMDLARYLDAATADGNYAQLKAKWAEFWTINGWRSLGSIGLGDLTDAPYRAFELSCINIKAAWAGNRSVLRWAVEPDLLAIKRIANGYKAELGYVMWPSLREAAAQRELLVAEKNRQVVGFVRFHARRDGMQTIYDIAVDRAYVGGGIGRALLNAVPRPVQLKCTADNPANGFYAAQGMTLARTEPGRQRALNVWRNV